MVPVVISYAASWIVLRKSRPASMFGVIEGFAVAGAIAAIVSAFKDAGSLFRKWSSQSRKAKENRELSELQTSLQINPANIESRYNDGYFQFGTQFARGDGMARSQEPDAFHC